MKQPSFVWNEETGTATCYLFYKDLTFEGVAKCHPQDQDFKSVMVGSDLAFMRAQVNYFNYVLKNEIKPELTGLVKLYNAISQSKKFNKDSYEARKMRRQIYELNTDYDNVKNFRDEIKLEIKKTIIEKEVFYQKLRETRAAQAKEVVKEG